MTNEMMVVVPPDTAAGAQLQVTAPSGQKFQVTVPDGVQPGQQFKISLQQPEAPAGTVVAAHNMGLAPGAWDGGVIGQAGTAGINVTNTLGLHHLAPGTKAQKKAGDGVMVPCSACGAENQAAMVMGNRAQFTCGHCGTVVLWRPRQVWLRDQGLPMEKPIHPQPGETDGMACCAVL